LIFYEQIRNTTWSTRKAVWYKKTFTDIIPSTRMVKRKQPVKHGVAYNIKDESKKSYMVHENF